MPTWMPEIIREHWKILLLGYVLATFIQTMPSPADKGPTSSWLYKWVFSFLHVGAAGIPRIIYTIFPQFVKFLPFNGQTQPQADPPTPKPQPPSNP
jgi:hypothetical protein